MVTLIVRRVQPVTLFQACTVSIGFYSTDIFQMFLSSLWLLCLGSPCPFNKIDIKFWKGLKHVRINHLSIETDLTSDLILQFIMSPCLWLELVLFKLNVEVKGKNILYKNLLSWGAIVNDNPCVALTLSNCFVYSTGCNTRHICELYITFIFL